MGQNLEFIDAFGDVLELGLDLGKGKEVREAWGSCIKYGGKINGCNVNGEIRKKVERLFRAARHECWREDVTKVLNERIKAVS